MTYEEYLAGLSQMHPGMTHGQQPGMGQKGAAAFDFMDQMRRSSGEAVRAGIQGNYDQFGGMLGDAMGPGIAAKGLLAAGTALGPAWLMKRMWGSSGKTAPRVADEGLESLRGSSKAPSIDDAMKYAQENDLTLNTAHGILSKQWYAKEIAKLSKQNYNPRKVASAERFAPEGGPLPDAKNLGEILKKQGGKIGAFDPRYANAVGGSKPRIGELPKLREMDIGVSGYTADPGTVSLADFEGRPFITSMSDRTAAGGLLTSINNKQLNSPVGLLGGQDYMFENPGQVWASGAGPAKKIHELAQDTKRLTGQDPLFLPWRMAPTGGDFATMTGETMLSYADVGMNKRNKGKANTAIKKLIPGWKGIGNPESISQFQQAPDATRKSVKRMLDKRFRDEGGLSVSQARIAVSDPRQLSAQEGGIMNLGEMFPDRPLITESGHPSYPLGVPGQGLGRLKEDANIFQLLPSLAQHRGVNPLNPHYTDVRAMQMKPYAGRLTAEVLKSLGL